jgi:hypothetical protein
MPNIAGIFNNFSECLVGWKAILAGRIEGYGARH